MATPLSSKSVPEGETIRCPNDNTRMERESVGGIVIDRCSACGRLWLDDGEMKALLSDQSNVDTADSGPFGRESKRAALGDRICPRDGTGLLEIKHPQRPDVLIEYCTKCRGVLLDAGELRQISGTSSEEATSWLKKVQKLVSW